MLQACHLATIKAIAIKHIPLERQLDRVLMYKVPKSKTACLLCRILISDVVLAPFVTAHLKKLQQRLGYSIEQLTKSTQNQYTSPITTHSKPYFYALSLHYIDFGLYTLWQVSLLYICTPMQK